MSTSVIEVEIKRIKDPEKLKEFEQIERELDEIFGEDEDYLFAESVF